MSRETPSKVLYELLVSRNLEPEALGRDPGVDVDLEDADRFKFDWVPTSGRNYGTAVILMGDDGVFQIFFGDHLARTMEPEDKQEWFDFLLQLKNFAIRNGFDNFNSSDINKLKHTLAGQAAIKEGLFESWQGRGDRSWSGQPTEARLIIQHSRRLGEGEARHHHIKSLFIETADQERYKLKFRNLTAGRAMLEHVRQGGNPYDLRGQHINSLVEELAVLSRFRRANAGQVFEGEAQKLVTETDRYYQQMRSVLKHLGNSRGYSTYFESWNPAEVTEQDVIIEDFKNLFVKQTIDPRIEQALPLLARITQEQNSMKETEIFESWINTLAEGTWSLPETREQQTKLIELLSKELPVGPDATNATEQLYDLVGDDELFDQLEQLAGQNADADARPLVIARLEQMSNAPGVAEVLAQIQQPAEEPAVQEADNLATFVEEGSECNQTQEGQYCPEHGLEECGVYEYTGNVTNFGLEEGISIADLKKLALGK